MWTGYNSKILADTMPISKIAYLKPLNKSPTDKSVIQHTLDLCLQVREELNQDYIEVTYDLNIACEALRIQLHNKEKYKLIFIHLGFFHVGMAFHHAIGKLIDESGLSTIMVESQLIAPGSINGLCQESITIETNTYIRS